MIPFTKQPLVKLTWPVIRRRHLPDPSCWQAHCSCWWNVSPNGTCKVTHTHMRPVATYSCSVSADLLQMPLVGLLGKKRRRLVLCSECVMWLICLEASQCAGKRNEQSYRKAWNCLPISQGSTNMQLDHMHCLSCAKASLVLSTIKRRALHHSCSQITLITRWFAGPTHKAIVCIWA